MLAVTAAVTANITTGQQPAVTANITTGQQPAVTANITTETTTSSNG